MTKILGLAAIGDDDGLVEVHAPSTKPMFIVGLNRVAPPALTRLHGLAGETLHIITDGKHTFRSIVPKWDSDRGVVYSILKHGDAAVGSVSVFRAGPGFLPTRSERKGIRKAITEYCREMVDGDENVDSGSSQ